MTNYLHAKRKTKKALSVFFVYVLLIIIAVVCAGPFLWFLSTSFKTGQNIYDLNLFYSNPSLENYLGVINFMNIPNYFLNTVIITGGAILIDVVLASLCAYPLALMDFPGKKFIFALLISSMIIPAAAGLVIKYLIVTYAHLINTFLGVIVPTSLTVFSIILLRQAYLGIPKELMDAAKIDGASELKIWAKILLPEIKPAVSTIVIFDFIAHWNDFLWPIIILQDPQKYPLATALQYLNGMFNYKFGYIAAGTIISIVPVIIIFLIFQKNYIDAISGAVKG
jgi:putative chitobiose transport system permease protein